ncbi:hypothetical protein [Bacteroides sp.]|uniref:lipopolysaccharide biosynthesis protein n=1 Tax=Bacteroides sp. TaxID=29523 RepID=UPI0025C57460|nr:hypothetical protein [Bacteroides sp.]
MEQASSNRRIAKNTLFLYIRMLFVMAVTLYTSRLVLDALGIEDYGLYNVVGGIVSIFAIINGALSSGSSRFITFELGRGDKERLGKTFSASFLIHTAIALIVFVLAETIGLWYVNNVLVVPEGRLVVANWLYQFSVLTCMLSLTQVPYSACIIAHEEMNIYAFVGIAEAVFKLLMVLFLTTIDSFDRLLFYGAMICGWQISLQFFYRFYCKRKFEECRLRIVNEKHYYKSMLRFSLWDVMGTICITGYAQGINLMINFFFGVVVNAARGIALQVEMAVSQFSNNFMVAVGPQITKLFSLGETEKMMSLVRGSSKYSFLMFCTISLPLFLKIDYVLGLWLKEVPEYSAIFIRCLMLCNMVRAFARPVVLAVHASGNIKWLNLYAGGASILLNLPLSYTAYILGFPPYACYVVCFFVNILCNYLELIVLRRQIPFSIGRYTRMVYMRSLVIVAISMVCMLGVSNITSSYPFFSLVTVCCTSVVTMAVCTYYIGMNKEDRSKIVHYIKSKICK